MRRWPGEDENLLSREYSNKGPEIEPLLKKYTKNSIYKKAHKLKLKVLKSLHYQKISKAKMGHLVSIETRNAISETLKKKYKNHELIPTFPPHLTKEQENERCQKISKTLKEKFAKGELIISKKKRKWSSNYMKENNPMKNPEVYIRTMPKIIAAAKKRIGSNHPRWNPNKSEEEKRLKRKDWEDIRLKVFRRDNFICQNCGRKCISRKKLNKLNSDAIIQCHHIIPWRISHDDSLSNLVTLCLKCHLEIERQELWDLPGTLKR